MKKTLIALAVAASAAVSGSAMAWEANGTGGSVNIGGSLTPVENITPWEVKTGAAVTGLDTDITRGQSVVNIAVDQAIPILGIRVADAVNKTFQGDVGINPQINYNGAIDTSAFTAGVVPLTLDVKNAQDQKIGKMVVNMIAYGESSWLNAKGDAGHKALYSDSSKYGFFGGLGTSESAVDGNGLYERIAAIDSGFVENYLSQGDDRGIGGETFDDVGAQFSGFYGSGIERGNVIKITLDQPVAGTDAITWKASLPVTVSYM